MAETPYKGYALYEPDASPDLTESGEYNSALMAVDADMHDEEQARIEGDTALNIAIANEMAQRRAADDALNKRVDTETAERKAADTALDAAYKAADAALDTAYKAADTALGKRIDNAEAEISANSADLTGIKGLTYGEQHVNFVENSNGEYSSPAFEEIKHEISDATLKVFVSTAAPNVSDPTLTYDMVKDVFKHSIVIANGLYLHPFWTNQQNRVIYTGNRENTSGHVFVSIKTTGAEYGEVFSKWQEVQNKPFSTIGTGLKVVDDALTVDTQALPSALTIMQLSEFGELTDNTGATHSAIGDGNAAAYAKLQQAWPSVIVVEGGTSWRCGMYTPSNVEQAGYILVKSANITDSAIQMRIHGGGFSGAITLEEIGG